ncbi:tetratricopeptide repeat protein [Bosea sp. R86505]|uniref:CHAT domain-containing tetratricopeptide repeat protein n=1 Tax=Bosea sp. R86505 TaxID=3101710 RepID=UPI00366B7776
MTRVRNSIGLDRSLANLAAMATAMLLATVAPDGATAQTAGPLGTAQAVPQAGPAAIDERLTAADIETLNGQVEQLYTARMLVEAEAVARRALVGAERIYGKGHIATVTSINILGKSLGGQGLLDEAETLQRRGLSIREKALPTDHTDIAQSLNDLAITLNSQVRLNEAEALHLRALSIREKSRPNGHPDIAASLNNLASVLASQNRLVESENLLRRALTIREKALPEIQIDVAISLNDLAVVLHAQERLPEAEALNRRALAIREKALPAGHPAIATSLANLSLVLARSNRLTEAEALLVQALSKFEKLPAKDPRFSQGLASLAVLRAQLGWPDDAEILLRHALNIQEHILPKNHPLIGETLYNLSALMLGFQRFSEADILNRRALDIAMNSMPADHRLVGTFQANLAVSVASRGQFVEALSLLDGSVTVFTAFRNRTSVNPHYWRASLDWRMGLSSDYLRRDGVSATDHVADARRSAFRDLQWERLGGTGGAIAAASARSQAADPEVGRLARERDRLLGELKRSDDRFIAVSSSTTLPQDERSRRMAELRTGSEALRRALEVADAEIGQRFPAYAELAEGRPLPVEELQPLLGPDEVLVSITPYDGGGFVFAYGREDGRVATLPQVGDVAALAARLRCSAALPDRTCAPGGPTAQPAPATAVAMAAGAAPGASAPAGAGAVRGPEEEALGRPDLAAGGAPFDLALAHDLYTRLFPEEIRAFVKGKRLILAPAPELLALPWHLLLTAPPPEGWDAPGTDRVALYKQAPWLFQSHPAITVLPTIASLRALRGNAVVRAPADRAFIGLGDPVIGRTRAERDAAPLDCAPAAAAAGPVQVAALRAPGSTENVFGDARGEDGFVLASVEAVRGQPRLPDSRCELIQIADTIAARQAQAEPGRDTAFPAVPRPARAGVDILLGPDASETRLKALNTSGELARYRILHFATHGLVSGELQLPEPALVLSPPAKASVQDDGLLTASEIATLTLAADWVVLSACNTAAGDAKGAEAFTGLAKAFFYAGAKSLLTSSWPVYSDAAVAITTLAFQNQHDGRAKALNHAMRDTLAAANSEHTAHPAYWAPFAIVGDGR